MPKTTFINLPSLKKQRILEVLLKNFSKRPISQVKVADIVEDMAMSRGAFYKYFDDLEDAYTYAIHYYSLQIHQDLLQYIHKSKQDFFRGIENYLAWCSTLDTKNNYWCILQFLTQSNDFSRHKRMASSKSEEIHEWFNLLKINHFSIKDSEEALSFLYFIMDLVITSLTDCIANAWTTKQLLHDYHYKVKWLQVGLKRRE
ncbi:TetR/AcrR family transcriptional regulator [Enterococcus ratti]|uniref:TetR/AcrR family transcriptional regulator n=1 Tax=Enterococcus ratti TaxID=150033 RepID=UPI00351747CB